MPPLLKTSTSPPASSTALTAAKLIFLFFSTASISRLAFVFELPLGATPVNIFPLSASVKFTKPKVPDVDMEVDLEGDFREWADLGCLRVVADRGDFSVERDFWRRWWVDFERVWGFEGVWRGGEGEVERGGGV